MPPIKTDESRNADQDIITELQKATIEAVKSGNIPALTFLLGANNIDLNDPAACLAYREHRQPQALLALATECIQLDGNVTELYLQEKFKYFFVDMMSFELSIVQKFQDALLTADASAYAELLATVRAEYAAQKTLALDEFKTIIHGLIKARDALIIEGKRLSSKEIKQEGLDELWLNSASTLIDSHFTESLHFLSQIDLNGDRSQQFAAWCESREAHKKRNADDIELGYQACYEIAKTLQEKKEGPLAELEEREKLSRAFLAHQREAQETQASNADSAPTSPLCNPIRSLLSSPKHSAKTQHSDTLPAIFIAAEDPQVTLAFFSARVPVNTVDAETGNSLLQLAIEEDQFEVAELLLKLGADPLIYNKQQKSALVAACEAPHGQFLRLILKSQALTVADESNPEMARIKSVLLKYTKTYSKRLNMSGCARAFFGYSDLMENRGRELAKYWAYFQAAKETNDPKTIIAIIQHDAAIAKRGAVNGSRLNGGLLAAIKPWFWQSARVKESVPTAKGQFYSWQERKMQAHEEAGMTAWCNQAQATYDLALPESEALAQLKTRQRESRADGMNSWLQPSLSLRYLQKMARGVSFCVPSVFSSMAGSWKGTSERSSYSSPRRLSMSDEGVSNEGIEDLANSEESKTPERQVSGNHLSAVTDALSSVGSLFARDKYQAKIAAIIDSCRGLPRPALDGLLTM